MKLMRRDSFHFKRGGGIDGAMHRAVLGVADALATVGMKLMEVTDLAAGYGRVGLD